MAGLHDQIDSPVLYLDFDGVLHPDAVYRVHGEIILKYDGIGLFEWAPLLVELLAPYPDIRIVLSTSWVRVISYDKARARLPPELIERVIGATWHSSMNVYWWHGLTRYQQVSLHARRHKVQQWLAIDDDATGWPDEALRHLVPTDSMLGLAATDSLSQLRQRLLELAS